MALEKMPETFGIAELAKGWFRHLFSTVDHQDTILDHLPNAKFYHPISMKPDKRKQFMTWYEEHKKLTRLTFKRNC